VLQVGLPAEFFAKYDPKTRADGLGVIVNDGRMRGQAVLCFILAFVRFE
jgi:hypothetical protein